MESLQVRAFLRLAVPVFIPLPYVSKLPLAINPLAYVLRTVHDLCASELTGSQRANEIHIGERQFLQIQYNFWSVPLNLSRQFLDMLRLKVTNQANRRSSAARFRVDPQMATPLCVRLPINAECKVGANLGRLNRKGL